MLIWRSLFFSDLSRWSLQCITSRPPQEFIDVGLLDTTGWVDLVMIPTKDHKLPWIPNASPDTCRVLHAPCIALISCDWSSTKIASLFVPAVSILANSKEITSFVHEDRKDYILLDRIPETDMAPHKLLVGRLVSFWGRHLFRWRSAREDSTCLIWTNATG